MTECNVPTTNDVLESNIFAVTKAEKYKCYYKWKICDVNVFTTEQSECKSGYFPRKPDGTYFFKNTFQLILSKKSLLLVQSIDCKEKNETPYITGTLSLANIHESIIKKFVINNLMNIEYEEQTYYNNYSSQCKSTQRVPIRRWLKFDISPSWELDQIPENVLIVTVDITIITNDFSCKDLQTSSISKYPIKTYCGDLLFKNKAFTDITFNVKDKKITAHKAVLAARSPIFAAMFSHNMTEKIKNRIDICDIEPTVFNEMLRFMYTEEVENLDTLALELFIAANKYQIEELQHLCQSAVCKNLTIDNAMDVLHTAEKCCFKELIDAILAFIKVNANTILKSEKYKLFIERYQPRQTSMLISALFEQML